MILSIRPNIIGVVLFPRKSTGKLRLKAWAIHLLQFGKR